MYTDKRRKIAHPFYSSAKWKLRRLQYLKKIHFICETPGCDRPATHVHHKDPLKDEDYFVNYEKCYGDDNLEGLCTYCHNRKPFHFLDGKGKQLVADGYRVNMVTGELEVVPPHTDLEIGKGKAVSKPYEKLGEER